MLQISSEDTVTLAPDPVAAAFPFLLGAVPAPFHRWESQGSGSATLPSRSHSWHRAESGFEPRAV